MLEVKLTPAGYLKQYQQVKRDELEKVDCEIQLELQHENTNSFDSKALQVIYDGIVIGYIQKRFSDANNTDEIEDYCFSGGVVNKLEMTYKNGVFEITT